MKLLKPKRVIWLTFTLQMLLGILLGGVSLAFNRDIAVSLVIGAWICALAQLAFALIALRPKVGETSGRMLSALYVGAMSKFLIAAVMFGCALGLVEAIAAPANVAAMLLAYAVTQLSLVWLPKA